MGKQQIDCGKSRDVSETSKGGEEARLASMYTWELVPNPASIGHLGIRLFLPPYRCLPFVFVIVPSCRDERLPYHYAATQILGT